MNPFLKAYWIAKGVGWDNVPRRLYQTYSVRSGKLLRSQNPIYYQPELCPLVSTPPTERLQQWSKRADRFFAVPAKEDLKKLVPQSVWNEQVIAPIDSAFDGYYPMFSRWTSNLGWPPNFNRDAKNGIDWPIGPCWPLTTKSGGDRDDIKLVWEPSRLTILYYLGRAYRYDGSEKYSEAIWRCIESWIEQNPINQTVAWGCGQEIAFRLMAILFGVFCARESKHTTPERLKLVDILAWQSALRIQTNINYAISQENNHALSEAIGLWTVGLLFPEFPQSANWLKKGRAILESEIERQIYPDGAYVQHSMSYHRVMLDDLVWAAQLGRINGFSLSEDACSKVRSAILWLDEFVDETTGRVPNLGANDGANILPLSCSDYLDYRPVLLVASKLFQVSIRDRDYELSKEKCAWLFGVKNDCGVVERKQLTNSWDSPIGGYAILRHTDGYLLLRGGVYRDRPGQCDSQHVDLWHKHVNVLRDAGSYYYYHRDPNWKRLFYSAESHNTVQVNGQEQMVKGPNFLWFRWPRVQERKATEDNVKLKIYYDSKLPYSHCRTIARYRTGYEILDLVDSESQHASSVELVYRWRLCPEIDWSLVGSEIIGKTQMAAWCQLKISGQGVTKISLVEGWESLYYGEKSRVPVLEVWTQLGTTKTTIEFLDDRPNQYTE